MNKMNDYVSRPLAILKLRACVEMEHDENDEQVYSIDADDAIETLEHLPSVQPDLTELIMQTYDLSKNQAEGMVKVLEIMADNLHKTFMKGVKDCTRKLYNPPKF